MRCPKCFHTLQVTGQARLETLLEHVSDPNGIPSMKDVYGCVNTKCEKHHSGRWDEWGASYGSRGEALFSYEWNYHHVWKHWNKFVTYPLIRLRVRIFGESESYKRHFGSTK